MRAARLTALLAATCLVGCASTTSTVLAPSTVPPLAAVLPLDGQLGQQAADLLASNFAAEGVPIVERAKVTPTLAISTDGVNHSAETYSDFAQRLGVHYLLAGTVSASGGPLYSYAHINMTLRLIDTRSGQTRWIGRYGNPMWSSAVSTQGDLQRAAHDLVHEFIRAGGMKLLSN